MRESENYLGLSDTEIQKRFDEAVNWEDGKAMMYQGRQVTIGHKWFDGMWRTAHQLVYINDGANSKYVNFLDLKECTPSPIEIKSDE